MKGRLEDEKFEGKTPIMEIKTKLELNGDGSVVKGAYRIPASEYHAVKSLSYTGLKEARKSPQHYQAYLRADYAETSSQRLGTLAHLCTLEPEKAESTILRISGNRNLKANREICERAEAEGKITANDKEWDQAWGIAKAVNNHPIAGRWLKESLKEISFFTTWPQLNLPVKARVDAWHVEKNVLLDLKTYSDLTEETIMRQIRAMRYHWQSAKYSRVLADVSGRPAGPFIHVFVEVDDPFGVRVVTLNDASLEKAEEEFYWILGQLASCQETGIWPGYPVDCVDLSLPDGSWS